MKFLFIFLNCNGDEACSMLEDLREKVQKTKIAAGEQQISVTMTFGLTEFFVYDGIDETLKEADDKLYHGKKEGRNRIIY